MLAYPNAVSYIFLDPRDVRQAAPSLEELHAEAHGVSTMRAMHRACVAVEAMRRQWTSELYRSLFTIEVYQHYYTAERDNLRQIGPHAYLKLK